jgi:hypothetical protein
LIKAKLKMNAFCQKSSFSVAVFSFNRPEYLKEVLESLERNRDIADADCFLFQDGAINRYSGRVTAREAEIEECIRLWEKASFPRKQLIRREGNVGMASNFLWAAELLFDELSYEEVLFFEDDLMISPAYIHLLRILLKQLKNDQAVGVVMCHGGRPRDISKEERRLKMREIRPGMDHLWGWAMWRDRWQRIKPTFLDYFKHVREKDPNKVNSKGIVEFFASQGFDLRSASQDTGLYYAMLKNGYGAINTVLPRGKYIGAKGWHMMPARYDEIGYAKVRIIDARNDEKLVDFEEYDPDKMHKMIQSKRILPSGESPKL